MHTDKLKQSKISRLVLFDIDQTLISSGGAGRRALYRALSETSSFDFSRPEVIKIRMSGKTDPQIVREFINAGAKNKLARSENEWQEIIKRTLDTYIQFLAEEIALAVNTPQYFMHAGVMELLQFLQQDKQIALGLLTGNIKKGARLKLEHYQLNRFFPVGAYGCDSADRLDLPAIAHKRAQEYYQFNLRPDQIIIIGDAENDVRCAKHYGAVSLAVNTGSTSWQELSALAPHYLFSSLQNTSQIIEAIMAGTAVNGVSK